MKRTSLPTPNRFIPKGATKTAGGKKGIVNERRFRILKQCFFCKITIFLLSLQTGYCTYICHPLFDRLFKFTSRTTHRSAEVSAIICINLLPQFPQYIRFWSDRAVDSRRNNVWSDCHEHTVSKGAAESTNQNQITLSTAVTLRPFAEEWGRKSSINAETAAQTKRRKTETTVDRQTDRQR